MAHVVCQVIGRPDRISLTWSEGGGAFDPYEICGQAFLNFKTLAAAARERLSDLVKEYLSGSEDDVRRASLELARVGSKLASLVFRPDAGPAGRAGKVVKRWVEDLLAQDAVTSLEIVADAAPPVPWNLLYDGEPVEKEFLAPDSPGDHWKGFWGLKYNLAVNRRVEPLRRLPLMRNPRVILVVDQGIQDGLPDDQQARLARVAEARSLPVIRNQDQLAEAVRSGRPDLIYWLCHADPTALILDDRPISPNDLLDLLRGEDDEKLGGIAFLNACQTAESTEQGSFLDALHEIGLSGIIATEHQTIDTFANPLGLDFLEAFLDSGEPIGAILQTLRRRVPLGLLYGTYCPPGLRVAKGDEEHPAPLGIVQGQRLAGLPLSATAPPVRRDMVPLPESPYRSLASYEREDRALFAGRDADVRRFARLLDAPGTKVVILHGESGVGKSSFLRAGVIPFLEEDCIGYRFVRDRSVVDGPPPLLFVRATQDLAGQIASMLSAACSGPVRYETPTGEPILIDLPEIIKRHAGGSGEPGALRQAMIDDPATLGRLLGELSRVLPYAAVLVIDQGEEIFTLAQGPDAAAHRLAALEILRATAAAAGNFKVIVSLRTEYYGRLVDRLRRGVRDLSGVRDYLLTDFDESAIAEVIRLPTSDVPVAFSAETPAAKYGFHYADGVPEAIARDVISIGSRRRDSPLPLVQLLCVQLYEAIKGRRDATIRMEDYRSLGGVEGGLRRGVEAIVASVLKSSPGDLPSVQQLFVRLHLTQADGTLTTALVPEDELARQWRGRASFGQVLQGLVDQQLLSVDSLRISGGEERRYVSLGHDALAKVAAEWERELRSRQRMRVLRVCAGAGALLLATMGYLAVRASERARASAEEARRHRFQSAMTESQRAWHDGDVARMKSLLDSLVPAPGERDLRGFEWRYLARIADSDMPRPILPVGLRCAAIADSGRLVALGRSDGSVALFDPKTNAVRTTLRTEKGIGPVGAVAISADGQRVAAVESNKMLVVWDVSSPSPLHEMRIEHKDEFALALSPDGSKLAASVDPVRVRIWDTKTGRLLHQTRTGPGMILGLAFTTDGRILAYARNHAIILCDLGTMSESDPLVASFSDATALRFSHRGHWLASGHMDGTIAVWDVKSGHLKSMLHGHKGRITSLSYASRDILLSSASGDTTIRTWNAARDQPVSVLRGHRGTFFVAAFPVEQATLTREHKLDLDGAELLSVSGEPSEGVAGQFRSWTMPTDQSATVMRGHNLPVWDVACSPDGEYVATCGADRTVRLWRGSDATLVKIFRLSRPVFSVAISPEGKRLAAGDQKGEITFFTLDRLESDRPIGSFLTGQDEPWRIRFLADGKGLVTNGHDMSVKRWDLSGGLDSPRSETLWSHARGILSPPLATGGATIASCGDDGVINLWTPDRGSRVIAPQGAQQAQYNAIAASPDGTTLAVGDTRGRITIWDVPTLARKSELLGHVGAINGLAFSPHGLKLASGGDDTTVKIWDLQAGSLTLTLEGSNDAVMSVAFLPGEKSLISASRDGFARMWVAKEISPVARP